MNLLHLMTDQQHVLTLPRNTNKLAECNAGKKLWSVFSKTWPAKHDKPACSGTEQWFTASCSKQQPARVSRTQSLSQAWPGPLQLA